MLILVTGGNGSGKSRFAESLASRFEGKRFYAATMIPFGDEGRARVEKHVRQRAGLGFVTVECPFSLDAVPALGTDLVLLEDVSNLLANLTFGRVHAAPRETTERQIRDLERRCAVLIAVTIGGLTGEDCDEPTRAYVRALNVLNGRLAETAAAAFAVEKGVPRLIKGECPWSF